MAKFFVKYLTERLVYNVVKYLFSIVRESYINGDIYSIDFSFYFTSS